MEVYFTPYPIQSTTNNMELFSIIEELWLFNRLFGNNRKHYNNISQHQQNYVDDLDHDCECADKYSSFSSTYIHDYDCYEHATYDYDEDFENHEGNGGFEDFDDF